MHYLIVPGFNNSGPTHWQSYWQRSFPDASRVVQRSWDRPIKSEWLEMLDRAVAGLNSDTILVSHSLGVVTTVLWLAKKAAEGAIPGVVKGAFLVAPADADVVDIIENFAPMPTEKLQVPCCVVASENDPYMTFERADYFAKAWGASLCNVGRLGHINADSNLGEWEQGRALLADFEKML